MNIFKVLTTVGLFTVFTTRGLAQTGSASNPFTQLGMAQNITTEGVYYFNLSGTTFSTYVRLGGWVQVAVDYGGGIGSLPQSASLTNSARGILSPSVLTKLNSANKARILCSNGAVDVTSTNATHITRIVTNSALMVGSNDNALSDSWAGTGSNYLTSNAGNCNATTNNGLHQRIFHCACNFNGMHWIPIDNSQQLANNQGNIASSQYLQLLVQAPSVAVVLGPTFTLHPSNVAQNTCINGSLNALSVTTSSASTVSYQWYSNNTSSNSGGTLISGQTSSSYTPPSNVSGTKYYYVIATNAQGSTTSSVSGAITIAPLSVGGNAGNNQSICSGTQPATLTLAGQTGSIQWQSSTDNVSFSAISGATGTSLTGSIAGNLSATTYFRAMVTSGACPSVFSNVVTISMTIAPVIQGTNNGSICGSGSVSLSASSNGGTISWFSSSSGGSAVGTGTSFSTPSISTTTTYYVSVTGNGCTSTPRIAVNAAVNPLPANASSTPGQITAEVLVVAGGGAGGYRHGGGGGAGGVLYQNGFNISSGSYPVVIGAGGTGNSVSGGNSTFSTLTAIGGGGGGNDGQIGKNGGSGGGGSNGTLGGNGTSGQGNKGGNQNNGNGCCFGNGAGGGGAAAAGANTTGGVSSVGGNGIAYAISGTSVTYGGGGGGGKSTSGAMAGGTGGGGAGGTNSSLTGVSGTANTGGGGGGGGANGGTSGNGGNGGSGIVIIKYAGSPIATGGTITQSGGYTIHKFTGSGTFAFSGSPTANVQSVSSCGAAALTFTGTVSPGYTLDWYAASNGGIALSSGTSNFTTPVIGATTTYYVAVQNSVTGCVSATRLPVTASIQGSANISPNQVICPSDSPVDITLNNVGGTVQWQVSNDGLTFTSIAGQTSSTLNAGIIGTPAASQYYRAQVTSGSCVGNSPVHTLTVQSPSFATPIASNDMVWNGKNSSSWSLASNWYRYNGIAFNQAVTAPTATDNVIIAPNQGCVLSQPNIESNTVYSKNLFVESGANLQLNNGSLNIYGNLKNDGTISAGTSTVTFMGGDNQDFIQGNSTTNFYNLSINKSNGNEVVLMNHINVVNLVTMNASNLNLNNYNLLLGTTGSILNEATNRRIYCDCANGYIERIHSIGASETVTPGNLGLTIETTGNSMGSTVIRRRHNRAGSGGLSFLYATTPGINRIYEVIPSLNGSDYNTGSNPGLNLNLNYTYFDGELGSEISNVEGSFGLYRSTDNGNTWLPYYGNLTVNSNELTFSNWDQFSWVTGGPIENPTSLPVEMVSFSAQCEPSNGIALNWVTASEYNSDYFAIESSRDGINWQPIATIAAAGNSAELLTYEWMDIGNDWKETIYYRLHQFDKDGAFEVFGPIAANCSGIESTQLQTFPNPSGELFSIRFIADQQTEDATLKVLDMGGRTLQSKHVELKKGENTLHLNECPFTPGIYLIYLTHGTTGTFATKHIVR